MAIDNAKTDALIDDMKKQNIWPEYLYRDWIAPTFMLFFSEEALTFVINSYGLVIYDIIPL